MARCCTGRVGFHIAIGVRATEPHHHAVVTLFIGKGVSPHLLAQTFAISIKLRKNGILITFSYPFQLAVYDYRLPSIRGGSGPRSKTSPFHIPFSTEKVTLLCTVDRKMVSLFSIFHVNNPGSPKRS